jgi:hypothetical protein
VAVVADELAIDEDGGVFFESLLPPQALRSVTRPTASP